MVGFICLYSRHFTKENIREEKACSKFLDLFMHHFIEKWEISSFIDVDNLVGPSLSSSMFFKRLNTICSKADHMPSFSVDKMKRVQSFFKKQGILEVATHLLEQQMDTEFIVLVTGLTIEEIEAL